MNNEFYIFSVTWWDDKNDDDDITSYGILSASSYEEASSKITKRFPNTHSLVLERTYDNFLFTNTFEEAKNLIDGEDNF